MKYCSKCGNELEDEAVVCLKCGSPTEKFYKEKTSNNDTLKTVAKVFMLISTILMGFLLIPLLWCIPMTIHYWSKANKHEQVGVGFKVCSLLFVSLVSGILMLCDND